MGEKVSERGFKRKTIVNNITTKVDAWCKSITDAALVEKIKKDYILTGGAIASMLHGELPNDYDIYFRNQETAIEVAKYYVGKIDNCSDLKCSTEVVETEDGVKVNIKSAGVVEGEVLTDYHYFEALPPDEAAEYFIKMSERAKSNQKPFALAMISSNAISLNDDIQIILRFTGNEDTIHGYYDFVHATNSYSPEGGLVLKSDALEAILTKELKYIGSKYPICSMFRLKKFIQRGWTITAGEMLKIAWDINKLDLDDLAVLQDQLTGVDAAYFHQLITLLKSQENIDRTYLYEAINRVFDNED